MSRCVDGWIDDPTACGDPDHCSPMFACTCNPDFDDEHDCESSGCHR